MAESRDEKRDDQLDRIGRVGMVGGKVQTRGGWPSACWRGCSQGMGCGVGCVGGYFNHRQNYGGQGEGWTGFEGDDGGMVRIMRGDVSGMFQELGGGDDLYRRRTSQLEVQD